MNLPKDLNANLGKLSYNGCGFVSVVTKNKTNFNLNTKNYRL